MAYLGITEKYNQTKTKIQVRWLPSPFNWFKLNSDGSSMGNPGLAGGGGLIQNEDGEWEKGYARAIAVVFELDAKLVVDLSKKDLEKANGINVLVADYIEGLKQIPLVRIQHCYREANKCADALV
nr:putative ribonuclease h protein [Quercus suber]